MNFTDFVIANDVHFILAFQGGSDEEGDDATTTQKKRDNIESAEDEPPAKTCKHEGSAAGNSSNTKTK